MDQWLIRTTENKIAGPYSKAQVCQLIAEGKLSEQDEVCAANGYWFYLYEAEEVLSQLGVRPILKSPDREDEITETENAFDREEETDPALQISSSSVSRAASSALAKGASLEQTVIPSEMDGDGVSIWKGWGLLLAVVIAVNLILAVYFLKK